MYNYILLYFAIYNLQPGIYIIHESGGEDKFALNS